MTGINPEENQRCLARQIPQERLLQVHQTKQGLTVSHGGGGWLLLANDSAEFRDLKSSVSLGFPRCIYFNFQDSIPSQSVPSL